MQQPGSVVFDGISPTAAHATTSQDQSSPVSATSEGSDIALFLVGSGFALFIALLAWSEQIQSMKKDTRDLEVKFISSTTLDKSAFLALMKSNNPDAQLDALNDLLISAKLKRALDIEALGLFRKWHIQSQQLEHLYAWKYRLTVILTIFLFLAGSLIWILPAGYSLHLLNFHCRLEVIFAGCAISLVMLVLCIVLLLNQRERRFHHLLGSISEKIL